MNVSGFHFDVAVTDMAGYDFVTELEARRYIIYTHTIYIHTHMYMCVCLSTFHKQAKTPVLLPFLSSSRPNTDTPPSHTPKKHITE